MSEGVETSIVDSLAEVMGRNDENLEDITSIMMRSKGSEIDTKGRLDYLRKYDLQDTMVEHTLAMKLAFYAYTASRVYFLVHGEKQTFIDYVPLKPTPENIPRIIGF